MKEGKTKRMDELVERVLEGFGLFEQYKEQEVYVIWPEVVGNMISSCTRKLEIVDGKLFVTFSSAVVKNEMLMVKEGLLKALNDRMGREVIKELIIR